MTSKEKRLAEFKNSLQLLELIQMAKAQDDPLVKELFEWSLLANLKGGRVAERARDMLASLLIPKALDNFLAAPEETVPEIIESKAQRTEDSMKEYREFIEECQTHPGESTVKHYLNLGWSRSKANRVKAELMVQDLLKAIAVKGERGRPQEILQVTDKAKALFGL